MAAPTTSSVALVLGGGRGIGAGVVRGLATRGYAVAIHCHASLREARGLAAEIESAGGRSLAVTANLREEGAVRAMMHRVADHFGRLDVVAACARLRRPVSVAEMTTGDLLAHEAVNVTGTFIVAQEALSVMTGQPEGGILVALATLGEPQPSHLAFATSQAAIPALMQSLAIECAAHHPQIQAACVTVTPSQSPAAAASTLLGKIDAMTHRS